MPDERMMTVQLPGLGYEETLPDTYRRKAPEDLFGPRSVMDPVEHYSPSYMSDMFGAGILESLHQPSLDAKAPGSTIVAEPRLLEDPYGKEDIILDPHDDRLLVPNPSLVPYRSICLVRTKMSNGQTAFGTGFMVRSDALVTAGHCIFPKSGGVKPKEIWVTPAVTGGSSQYPTVVSKRVRVPDKWRNNKDDRYDYAVILLPDGSLGAQTGWFGLVVPKDSHLPNLQVMSAGYPSDKGSTTMYSCPGRVHDSGQHYLQHSVDTIRGQSGSPLFQTHITGDRTVVGIHIDNAGDGNRALRITAPIFHDIMDAA